MRPLTLLMCFIIGWLYLWWTPTVHPYPASGEFSDPTQELVKAPRHWSYRGADFSALAHYSVTARVLSTERYWFDPGSRYSPVDFVLGWGAMSDFSVAEKIHLTQGLRFYGYSWESTPPINPQRIALNSSNHHLIAANDTVRSELLEVRPGDVVTLEGALVEIQRENWIWRSSLSRSDSGNGACELMWVERIRRLHSDS